MPLNHLARFLYPKQGDWNTRKHFKTMIRVIFVTVAVGSLVAGLMLYLAYKK